MSWAKTSPQELMEKPASAQACTNAPEKCVTIKPLRKKDAIVGEMVENSACHQKDRLPLGDSVEL
jgi:hypothetical protein